MHFSSRELAVGLTPPPRPTLALSITHWADWFSSQIAQLPAWVAAGFLCGCVCLCFKSPRKEYFSTRERVRMLWPSLAAGIPLTTLLPGAALVGVVCSRPPPCVKLQCFHLVLRQPALLLAPCWPRKAAVDPTSDSRSEHSKPPRGPLGFPAGSSEF